MYTIDETFEILSKDKLTSHKETVRNWVRKGAIQAEPLESRKKGYRISEEELEQFIKERMPDGWELYPESVTGNVSVADDTEQRIIDRLYQKYRGNPFSLYIRLIQAASSPELVLRNIDLVEMFGEDRESIPLLDGEAPTQVTLDPEEVRLLMSVRETRKFRRAIETVTSLREEGKTAVVWCMFVHTIDRVHEELMSRGIKSAVIYGSTPQGERERLIKAFQDREFDVIVTNPHTLAESVSLHHVCHDAVYLEYSFNLTHMLQSRDRIHRLGLPDGQYTRYHYMLLEGQPDRQNTVDEKIYVRLKEKEQRMMKAIENGDLRPDPNVDYDEIVALFD